MVPIQQYLLALPLLFGQQPPVLPDDPLQAEPPPVYVKEARSRAIDDTFDFAYHSFATPARHKETLEKGPLPRALDVNTMGEVMDSAWYTNRHGRRRMPLRDLLRGPGDEQPPSPNGLWTVIAAKSDGVTPGFTIQDAEGRRFVIKFDPPTLPELSSSSDIMGSKFFYALGYFTPENYIVELDLARLQVSPDATHTDSAGRKRALTMGYVRRLVRPQPRIAGTKRFRVLASRLLEGQPLGPYRYAGQRKDDPNDIWPHEDRRSLRALQVFCAWLNHTDSRSINSLDMLVDDGPRRYVRHYLIDFGSSFGSDSVFAKEISRGHLYDVEPRQMGKRILTLGLAAPDWERVKIPKLRGVGRFESKTFDPRLWKPAYPNPAFLRMDEEDAVWAARQVAAFTDAEIEAIVGVARFSDPRSARYMTKVLIERRDAIVAAYLTAPLRLTGFEVKDGRLTFTDARSTAEALGDYQVSWEGYSAPGPAIPDSAAGPHVTAVIRPKESGADGASVSVTLRRGEGTWEPVAVANSWRVPLNGATDKTRTTNAAN